MKLEPHLFSPPGSVLQCWPKPCTCDPKSLTGGKIDNHDVVGCPQGVGEAGVRHRSPWENQVPQGGVHRGRHSSGVDSWAQTGSRPGMKGPARNRRLSVGARGLTAAAGAPTMQAAGVCGPEDGAGVVSHDGGEAGAGRVVVREAWG